MATNGDNQTATAKKTEKGKKLEKIHTHTQMHIKNQRKCNEKRIVACNNSRQPLRASRGSGKQSANSHQQQLLCRPIDE